MALLYTNENFPFVRLHRNYPDHAGIIVCSQDADIQGQAKRIHQAIASQSSLAGQLIRIHRPQG